MTTDAAGNLHDPKGQFDGRLRPAADVGELGTSQARWTPPAELGRYVTTTRDPVNNEWVETPIEDAVAAAGWPEANPVKVRGEFWIDDNGAGHTPCYEMLIRGDMSRADIGPAMRSALLDDLVAEGLDEEEINDQLDDLSWSSVECDEGPKAESLLRHGIMFISEAGTDPFALLDADDIDFGGSPYAGHSEDDTLEDDALEDEPELAGA